MEIKQCSVCGKVKPIDEFAFRDKSKGTRRANCKKCHSSFMSQRYKENKAQLDKTKKNKCCIRCGYNECVEALDYHHIDPSNKIDTVAKLSTHSCITAGLEEAKKCVLLCANCHRYFHLLKRQQPELTLEDFIR